MRFTNYTWMSVIQTVYIMYCFLQFKYFPSVSEEITADLTKPKTPIRDDWYHNGLVNMVYFGFM